MLREPRSWGRVRHWLRTLAEELDACRSDPSQPDLAFSRVWITPDDRVKLLEWTAPDVQGPNDVTQGDQPRPSDTADSRRFLASVAVSALRGRNITDPGVADWANVVLPIRARKFLPQLGHAPQSLEQDRLVLDALADGATVVSRKKRMLHLGIFAVMPIVTWTYLAPGVLLARLWATDHPSLVELSASLQQLERFERRRQAGPDVTSNELESRGFDAADLDHVVQALEIHVASQFLAMDVAPSSWEQPYILPEWREVAARAVAAHPSPSPQEVGEATATIGTFLAASRAEFEDADISASAVSPLTLFAVLLLMISLSVSATLGLVTAVVLRGGVFLRILGMGIVTQTGSEASRLRTMARAAVWWLPLLPAAIVMVADMRADYLGQPEPPNENGWWVILSLVLVLLGALSSVYRPHRGWQDRLARTYLVPR